MTRASVGMNSTLNFFIKAQLSCLSKARVALDAVMLDPTLPLPVNSYIASLKEYLDRSISLGEHIRRIGYDLSETSSLSLATLTLAQRDQWLAQLPEHKVSKTTLGDMRFAPISEDLFKPDILSTCAEEIKSRRGEILHQQWEAAATLDALNLKRKSPLAGLETYKAPFKRSKPPKQPETSKQPSQLDRVQAQLTQAKAELAKFKAIQPPNSKSNSSTKPFSRKPTETPHQSSHRGRGRGHFSRKR